MGFTLRVTVGVALVWIALVLFGLGLAWVHALHGPIVMVGVAAALVVALSLLARLIRWLTW